MRKENFERLLALYPTQKHFCEATGVHPTSISQILQGKRPLGEALIRRIELALGLPTGWFDIPHEKMDLPDDAPASVNEENLFMAVRKAISAVDQGWDLLSGHPIQTLYGRVMPDLILSKGDKHYAIEFKSVAGFRSIDQVIALGYKLKQAGFGLIFLHQDPNPDLDILAESLEQQGLVTRMAYLKNADVQTLQTIFYQIAN